MLWGSTGDNLFYFDEVFVDKKGKPVAIMIPSQLRHRESEGPRQIEIFILPTVGEEGVQLSHIRASGYLLPLPTEDQSRAKFQDKIGYQNPPTTVIGTELAV